MGHIVARRFACRMSRRRGARPHRCARAGGGVGGSPRRGVAGRLVRERARACAVPASARGTRHVPRDADVPRAVCAAHAGTHHAACVRARAARTRVVLTHSPALRAPHGQAARTTRSSRMRGAALQRTSCGAASAQRHARTRVLFAAAVIVVRPHPAPPARMLPAGWRADCAARALSPVASPASLRARAACVRRAWLAERHTPCS
jgi:hypothetical protein